MAKAKQTTPPKYKLGKPYNPQSKTANNNYASWQTILGALKTGPKTLLQLQGLKPAHPAALANHPKFCKWVIRRNWLAVA